MHALAKPYTAVLLQPTVHMASNNVLAMGAMDCRKQACLRQAACPGLSRSVCTWSSRAHIWLATSVRFRALLQANTSVVGRPGPLGFSTKVVLGVRERRAGRTAAYSLRLTPRLLIAADEDVTKQAGRCGEPRRKQQGL